MSAPDVSEEMMAQLREAGVDDHVTLLLGAGASSTSGLPTWDELATRLLMRSGSVRTPESAVLLLERQDPLLVAEAARKALGDSWQRHVKGALYEGVAALDPSPLHNAAASHLLAGDGSDTTLLTLNFDTLLEDAIASDTDTSVLPRTDDKRTAGAYVVHHLHGIVNRDVMQKVVLTLSDFNELLGDDDSWQLRLLKRAVGSGALVIAGTSYRDPDLRRWLHEALAQQQERHAAVVLLARQAFGLDRTQFEELRTALMDQWSAAGLQPVIMEDFADAAQIVRELRHVQKDGYCAPQVRARQVWDAHAVQFAELQRSYSDQLAEDAVTLLDALDVDRLNVTLWLADAQGNIARWASQDRYYRNLQDVRLVASGHDSPWVAARALGAESIQFQDLANGGVRRWSTVLATPVRVEHSGLPDFTTAVISVGLPGVARDYEPSVAIWSGAIVDIANAWSERLKSVTEDSVGRTLTQRGQ